MKAPARKTVLTALGAVLVVAAIAAAAPRLIEFAGEKIGSSLRSPKFDIKSATRDGFVHLAIEGHRFKIPQRYVSGVTTWQDGSVASVNVRLVLPGLEPYDPNNKQHQYEFSPYVGGGWRNKLYLSFGQPHPSNLDTLYNGFVVGFANSAPGIRVTPRLPESDDPEGVEIYSSPNKQESPDQNGRIWWRPGQDHFVVRDGSHTTFYARCYRQVPDQFPDCKGYADFGPDLNAEYEYGRPHFVRDWKHIHEHITGLIRSWMEPDLPNSQSTAPSR